MNWIEKPMMLGARVAAKTWPVMGRVFTEKLEVDENRSLWASYTPDYQPGPPLEGDTTADLAIIGGGFTGVSTAYHFSRRYPEKRVVLLEAKSLANGASGRNGGMMLNKVTDPLSYATDEMVKRVYDTTHNGIKMILEIIERHNLEVSYQQDGSLTVYTDTKRAEIAHAEAEHYQSLGVPIGTLSGVELAEAMNLQGAKGATLDPNAGQLNGAQFVRALRPVLTEQGVEIYEGTPVIKIREGQEIELTTPQGKVGAKAIVLATNGYTGTLGYFRDALFPLHSHVLATEPLTQEQRTALGWHKYNGFSDDYDRISYSVITKEGHLVFGGGSNQSYDYLFNNRTAYPGTPDSAKSAFDKMHSTMVDYLPESRSLPVAHRWTGTLGITLRRNNLMGVRGEYRNVFYAIGYCGHGVTLANIAGRVLTDIYSGDDEEWRGLPFYMPDYSRIPPEPFRWVGYQIVTRATGRSPRAY